MKGLPLAYNRDLQEDKEPLFDSVDQSRLGLAALSGLLATVTFDSTRMQDAANGSSVAAVDLAEWLVQQGMPFRQAHSVVGGLVHDSLERHVPLAELVEAHPALGSEAVALLEPGVAVTRRTTPGSAGPEAVAVQTRAVRPPARGRPDPGRRPGLRGRAARPCGPWCAWEAGGVTVLLVVGFLGGLVTGISPCILPVLPVIFASGAASGLDDPVPPESGEVPETAAVPSRVAVGGGGAGAPAADGVPDAGNVAAAEIPSGLRSHRAADRRRRRPFAVVTGLVLSFSVTVLAGSWLLSALGLPAGLLRWAGITVLALLGLGLLVPSVGDQLERPFTRVTAGRAMTEGGGFVLGLSLGLVFVPCAGPVLAAVAEVGARHHIGWSAVFLTAAFAVGVAIPLLVFALAGRHLATRMPSVRNRAATVRRAVGAVLVATALVLALGLTDGLQRAVPGYTGALQNRIEGSASAKQALGGVTGQAGGGALATCTPASPVLQQCGPAPPFGGIARWLQTPDHRPLTVAGLRGRVVLVDFWTYSCINCQRSLPHVEAWNAAYAKVGLSVVGVHTPEFAFEHAVGNVTRAAAQLGVHYPIAVDNDYTTWNNYQNAYWPAEYLVDASGTVRHVDDGEGQYGQTETFIRQLLVAADPTVVLPPRTDVPDRTPQVRTTPESYLGYHYAEPDLADESVTPDAMTPYLPPAALPPDTFAFGGQWDVGSEGAAAGKGATLTLRYEAEDVYLVLGGSGEVRVTVDGAPARTVAVSGEPRLYPLVGPGAYRRATLQLAVSPGVEAYDFTFG